MVVAMLSLTATYGAGLTATTRCRNDDLGPESLVRAPQNYGASLHARALTSHDDWEPLRLHFTPRNISLTTYQEDYLFQRLLPAAAEWLGFGTLVFRYDGNTAMLVLPERETIPAMPPPAACGGDWPIIMPPGVLTRGS